MNQEQTDFDFNQYDLAQTVMNKASKDKFLVILDVPKILRERQSKNIRLNQLVNRDKWQFSTSKINIPEVTVESQDLGFYGQHVKVTGQSRPAYSPIQIGFTVDNGFDNYHLLWNWLDTMNKARRSWMDTDLEKEKSKVMMHIIPQAGMDPRNPSIDTPRDLDYLHIGHRPVFFDYMTTITVYALREYDEPIFKWTMFYAFPKTLGGIEYDYASTDAITSSISFEIGQMDTELLAYSPSPSPEHPSPEHQ